MKLWFATLWLALTVCGFVGFVGYLCMSNEDIRAGVLLVGGLFVFVVISVACLDTVLKSKGW